MPDVETPEVEHVDTILKMPETRGGVDNVLLKAEQWVLQFDGGASLKRKMGSGGVVLWHPGGYVVDAHALWFTSDKPTVNCAEMAALVWGLELLVGRRAGGRVLVLGDSELTIDFCTRKASPGKPELFRGLKRINALRREVRGAVVFRHIRRNNNQLADWLTRVASQL